MKKIIYSLLFCGLALSASAQDTEGQQIGVYQQAEDDYDIGRIDTARVQLLNHISDFRGNVLQSAYRLLALCSIASDNDTEAEGYVKKLLDENPYYSTTLNDPPRFIDMVERIRSGRTATITTASSQSETLSEVPVPTVLITEEMIRNCGGRNLQEVLAAYVPGMHIVDGNDDINIAMRGIYSNGQEKILIMLNGHRLNSYATNIGAPDFSISLEKLKQIEVLRGPASSLYGGVALTAVVNLITKQGADVDGIQVKGAYGNYGQANGNILFGKRYFDLDLLIWGSIYHASGEKMNIEPEEDIYNHRTTEVVVGRIGKKPSYDFGIQMKWKDLQFLYDTHFSQIVAPLTMSTLAKPYLYDDYKTYNGIKPSFATKSHHADLSYQRSFGKLNLTGRLTYDNSDLTHYQVISEYEFSDFGHYITDNPSILAIFAQDGLSRYINGQEQNYGVQLKGDISYINTKSHKGSLAFGAEFSHFQLDDVRYMLGYNYTSSIPEIYNISELGKGNENSYNAFLQLKHQWGPVILNAGLRYDHKNRGSASSINEFSPRVALIFLQPKWNVKLSYSKSFVDAPYLYRKTNSFLMTFQSNTDNIDEDLMAESLHSYQLTFAGNEWIPGLNFEVNGFYNRAKNIIMTHIIEYLNEGNNEAMGVELMANYRLRRFTADFNMSWIHTMKNNVLARDINTNNNTPKLMSNLVLGWQATKQLKLHSHLGFMGKQETYNTDIVQIIAANKFYNTYLYYVDKGDMEEAQGWYELYEMANSRIVYARDLDARVILDLGAEYQLGKVVLGVDIHNLFNTHGNLSGMNAKRVPQKGRWFTFSVAYKF